MTLERIEHKVFASEAPLEEMGQFGSALATTKLNTKDVAEIQALPAYTKGWGSAIISENNYPAMEEMNGVLNVMSYHTGYLYQEGIPVYSSTQTYSATSMVKSLDGKSIYRSLKGDNKGNPLEDETSWELFDFSKGALKTNQITNCITEIPQRIKLELADGTLTLKAGSEVIFPNGFEADGTTPKFDYVTIESDQLLTEGTDTEQVMFFARGSTGILLRYTLSQIYSGSSAPTVTTQYARWYDTSTNKIKDTSDTGVTWTESYTSLPLGIGSTTDSSASTLAQVFNGMGYIGSTVWVDKGVKGLIPNGRNEDGTLKNIEYTADKIYMRTFADTINLTQESLVFTPFNPEFSYFRGTPEGFEITQDGFIYSPYRDEILKGFVALSASSTNGKITNFTPKLPFRAIDYSDKSEVSGWGMPSGKQIDLTLGASGTEYTAPANGWVSVCKTATASNQNLDIGGGGIGFDTHSSSNGQWLCASIPVRKGTTFYVNYTAGGATNWFRFRYAQGEV